MGKLDNFQKGETNFSSLDSEFSPDPETKWLAELTRLYHKIYHKLSFQGVYTIQFTQYIYIWK